MSGARATAGAAGPDAAERPAGGPGCAARASTHARADARAGGALEAAPRRFVVLEHARAPDDVHWDLMVEDGPVLVTWQLAAPPGPRPVAGRRSFDHRPRYLDYEGPLDRERGRVRALARGLARDLAGDPRAARYEVALASDDGARPALSGVWRVTEVGTEGAEVLVEVAPVGPEAHGARAASARPAGAPP